MIVLKIALKILSKIALKIVSKIFSRNSLTEVLKTLAWTFYLFDHLWINMQLLSVEFSGISRMGESTGALSLIDKL